ncbi:MAG: TolC family protein [Thermonemataceae bacterium]
MKLIHLKAYLLGLCLCTLSMATAQQAPDKNQWSLKECIDYGIENNLTIKQSQLQVQSSQSTFQQSREGRLPTVTGRATQSIASGRSIDPFTNEPLTETINSTRLGLNANWVLFNGFNQTNTIRQNETNFQADQLDVEQSKRDISLNIATAYLQVLLNQELLNASQNQVLATKGQLERTQKLFEAGSIAENEVIDLKAQLANDEISVTTARNQLSIAKVNLMQLMNLPVQQDFEVIQVDVAQIDNPYASESPQAIYREAVGEQYNVQSADLRIKSSEYAVNSANGNRIPSLSLNASVSTLYSSAAPTQILDPDGTFSTVITPIGFLGSNPSDTVFTSQQIPNGENVDNGFFNQLDFNLQSSVGLTLTVPIYNAGQIRNNVTQAKINKKIAEYQSENVRIQLRQDIEQAYNDMRVAATTYDARERQVESLQLAYETTETRFNVGAANSVDFNLAKINLDRARADLIRAKYDYAFRIKVLDFYVNKPLDF